MSLISQSARVLANHNSTQLHPFNNVTGLCPSCLISKSVVILDFEGQRLCY
jgi:hypothetical protein